MQLRPIFGLLSIGVAIFFLETSSVRLYGQDLIEAPEGSVLYELSNLRVEKGIVGDQIAFDYKRTREGTGKVTLTARTDRGPLMITGFGTRIEATGTIYLEDRFARTRSILNPGNNEFGVEFYFTMAEEMDFSRKRYLVSNSVVHGTMNTRVQSRPLTAEELRLKEIERKSRAPPETVPAGYLRSDASTLLVPGAPVLIGRAGEWVPGKVVSVRGTNLVKVLQDGQKFLSVVPRLSWLAIAEQTVKAIQTNPSQFSIDVRTLPDGNLLLTDDIRALHEALPQGLLSLPPGTPLMKESSSRWEDVYFLSSDNVSVRVLPASGASPREEKLSVNTLAIRQRTLDDLASEAAKVAFAANVVNYRPSVSAPQGMASSTSDPTRSGSMASSVPFPRSEEPPRKTPGVERVWKDQTGKFSITATMERKTDVDVFLKRTDGSEVKVPIAKLSAADQSFIANEGAPSDANPFTDVVSSSVNASGPLNYRLPLKGVFAVSEIRWGAKSLAISPDDRFLLIGRKAASASMHDLTTGRVLVDSGRMEYLGDISVCGFTPDSKHLLLGGAKGIIEVYTMSDKGALKLKLTFASHTKEVTSLAFSQDGKFALTGGEDKQAWYWEIESGRELKTLNDFEGKVKATHISGSGGKLMATDGKSLKMINTDGDAVVKTLQVARSHVSGQSAAFSPNGLLLAVGDSYNFHLWNLQEEAEMPQLEGQEIAWSAVFAPDNQHLLTGGNGVINVWDTMTQTRVQSFPVTSSYYIQAITANRNGSLIASPSGHGSVGVFQATR